MKTQHTTLPDYLERPPSDVWRSVCLALTGVSSSLAIAHGIILLLWAIGVEDELFPGVAGGVFSISLPIALIAFVLYRKANQRYQHHYAKFMTFLTKNLTQRYDLENIRIHSDHTFMDWSRSLVKHGAMIKATQAGTDIPLLLTVDVTPEGDIQPRHRDIPLRT